MGVNSGPHEVPLSDWTCCFCCGLLALPLGFLGIQTGRARVVVVADADDPLGDTADLGEKLSGDAGTT